jgi:sugar/nucleoside kinase (ribokinase family)
MRLGLLSTFVWDVIHGRGDRQAPTEEWGGAAYSLGALDAALPDDWEIVPIIKVGADLADRARAFTRSLSRVSADTPLIEVPHPNSRVELRYHSDARRSEIISGGVPGWTWLGLKPVLETARLDALYINFISGWELDLETTQLIRQHFRGPIYCDLHMLVMAVQPTGLRTLRPLADVREWCGCFDILQMNEDEMSMTAPDPMALAATALHAGTSLLVVTLAKRGAVYFADANFERLADLRRAPRVGAAAGPMRTALVPVEPELVTDSGDPTGCGDVWGATHFSRLLAGDTLGDAMRAANRAAARNVEHRGASGLANHLRGKISLT